MHSPNERAPETFDYKLGPQGAADRARLALGNNVVRGLVELITNSDTAYDSIEDPGSPRRRIAIEYSSTERRLTVRDQAGGMSPDLARTKFTQGGDTSEAGGRGYFGVGAKDCAVFGSLVVETVDSSGAFTRIEIPKNYQGATISRPRAARKADYDRLFGRRQRSGTVATIHLASRAEGGPRLPRYNTIEEQLRGHFALRSLLDRNTVILIDRSKTAGDGYGGAQLRYGLAPWENPDARQQFNGELSVDGFPDAHPHLKLFDVGEGARSSQDRNDQFDGFVLVRSPAADHGYFLAGSEYHPHAARIAGELMDPYIQTLLDEFRNDGPTEHNDRPIIRQDRQPQNGGLDSNHPYYRALATAVRPHVEAALETVTKELQDAERAGISQELQKANLEAGAWLGNYLEEDSTGRPQLPDGFYFLPSSARLGLGATRWLTLYSVGKEPLADGTLTVSSDADGIVEIEEVSEEFSEPAVPSGGGSTRQRAKVLVQSRDALGSATLTASYEQLGREMEAAEADVHVVLDPPPEQEFRFEHSSYSIRPNAQKVIRVVVPFDLVGNDILERVQFRVEADEGSLVTVGPSVLPVSAAWEDFVREANILEFRIEARGGVGISGKLHVRFREHDAAADVRSQGTSIPVFDDDNDLSPPDSRAVVYGRGLCPGPSEHGGGPCLHFFLRHKDVERWLGDVHASSSGDLEWDLADTHGFRAMRADAIAEAAAQYRVLGLNRIREAATGEPVTPDEVLRLFWQEKKRALPQMQRIYIGGLPDPWESQPH